MLRLVLEFFIVVVAIAYLVFLFILFKFSIERRIFETRPCIWYLLFRRILWKKAICMMK